jgi:hypothetical protein
MQKGRKSEDKTSAHALGYLLIGGFPMNVANTR